jgi:hypothetical protein
MLTFSNLTGKKNVKSFNEEVVIFSPTPGDLKITPLVAKKLGIRDGDCIVTVEHNNGESTLVYIAKGITGVPVLDAEGNPVKAGNGRVMFEEGSDFGAIVRPASEGSPLLKATVSAAWAAIGGSTEENKKFSLAEGVEGQVPTGRKDANGDDIMHVTTFYQLEFASSTPKIVRTKGDGSVEEVEEEEGVEGIYDEEEV